MHTLYNAYSAHTWFKKSLPKTLERETNFTVLSNSGPLSSVHISPCLYSLVFFLAGNPGIQHYAVKKNMDIRQTLHKSVVSIRVY